MKPYIILCEDCFAPYVGEHIEELTIGILQGQCERCGAKVGHPDYTIKVSFPHTPRRDQIAAVDARRKEKP